jgi:hypothetical protein
LVVGVDQEVVVGRRARTSAAPNCLVVQLLGAATTLRKNQAALGRHAKERRAGNRSGHVVLCKEWEPAKTADYGLGER